MENQVRRVNDETEIDLWEIFLVLVGKIPQMIAVGLFAALIAFMYTMFVVTPTYESTTKIYILSKQNSDSVTYSDLQMGSQLTQDYAELIQSRFVLEEVIEQMGLQMDYSTMKRKVSVTTPTDTRIISITVTDANPVKAMRIANAIREASSAHIQNVMDIEAVNVVETANVPSGKASPAVGRNTMLGGMLGVLVIAGITVITYMLNDTIKTAEDVEKYLGLSTLAIIPLNEGEKKSKRKVRRSR